MANHSGRSLARIIWKPDEDTYVEKPKQDWRSLGNAVQYLCQSQWEKNMLFFGARDEILKRLIGTFPATHVPDRTHPLFVSKSLGKTGHKVCPCSTKSKRRVKYIHKGCVLEPTRRMVEHKTFILSHLTITLTYRQGRGWTKELLFMGLVPELCIRRKTHG